MDKHKTNREPRRTVHAPAGLVLSDKAGEILGCAPWTVREKARRGVIPHYRPYGPRGRIAFSVTDLEAWIRTKRVEPRQ